MSKFRLDEVDHQILDMLIDNTRVPFTDIAKKLLISAGTVHVRVKKMEDAGTVSYTHLDVYKRQDFYLGLFTRGITEVPMHFVGKKELFKFPFGWYFKWMGGKPLDRTGGLNKVDAIAKTFGDYDELRLAIAPEGTRKLVSELKTGFYYIALKANVPILPVAFDFGKKEVSIGKSFFPTGTVSYTHLDVYKRQE